MDDLISIIVPIYNVENYLKECLNSIGNQSYNNFEVLLVNDGSPDNSENICLDFINNDIRFKYYYKDNGGVSSARNLGLDHAKGKFIVFIDSDDIVEENYLKDFVEHYDDDDTLIIQDLTKEIGGVITKNRLGFLENKKYNFINDFDKLILNSHILEGFPVNKFFLNSIIKNNNIKFKRDITHKEDEIFCLEYYLFIQNIKIIPNSNYHYINRDHSITSSHPKFDSEYIYLLNYINILMIFQNKINYKCFNNFFSEQLTLRYKYIMYNINYYSGLNKNQRITNLKKIFHLIYKYEYYIQKSTVQKLDFIMLKFKQFFLIDLFILMRNKRNEK